MYQQLTHWGQVTHIYVGNLTIIGSDNGLSPGRLQAIIWTNDGILLIGPLGTNFSEILIGIHKFSFTKIHLKMSSAKWGPFTLGFNALMPLFPSCICPSRPWGGWGCDVSCGGHHRPRGKTTTGSALDGAVFDIAQIMAYLVHNMSRSQSYLGFGHFGWLPSFFGQ